MVDEGVGVWREGGGEKGWRVSGGFWGGGGWGWGLWLPPPVACVLAAVSGAGVWLTHRSELEQVQIATGPRHQSPH